MSQGLLPVNFLSSTVSAVTPSLLKGGVKGVLTSAGLEGVEEGALETAGLEASLQGNTGLTTDPTLSQVASEGLVGSTIGLLGGGTGAIVQNLPGLDVTNSAT